jgi:hypothetical protein
MQFDPNVYGEDVARILALDGGGCRLMPLTATGCSVPEVRKHLEGQHGGRLFGGAAAPEAALSGLWLYFSFFDEAHRLAQEISSREGSYWHAIVHRQEPDPGNAAYWFRRVGQHPVFPRLLDAAGEILETHRDAGFRIGRQWDPHAFLAFCESARTQPGSADERAAMEIQRAEWQLLFDRCARPR